MFINVLFSRKDTLNFFIKDVKKKMDRFSWISSDSQLQDGESLVIQQRGLRIYDGENKVNQSTVSTVLFNILVTEY